MIKQNALAYGKDFKHMHRKDFLLQISSNQRVGCLHPKDICMCSWLLKWDYLGYKGAKTIIFFSGLADKVVQSITESDDIIL